MTSTFKKLGYGLTWKFLGDYLEEISERIVLVHLGFFTVGTSSYCKHFSEDNFAILDHISYMIFYTVVEKK